MKSMMYPVILMLKVSKILALDCYTWRDVVATYTRVLLGHVI